MALTLLLQMAPGKMGNVAHEMLGVAFVALFVFHHVLNRGWLRRLGRQRTVRARCVLLGDVLLTVCVLGTAASGLMMSHSVAPQLAVPQMAHVVRPLHGASAYMALIACAFHVGLHLRMVRGYAGRKGSVCVPLFLLAAAVAVGLGAFVRLDVLGKLLGRPSFPDALTPLGVQLALHLALCLPFFALGAVVDVAPRRDAR